MQLLDTDHFQNWCVAHAEALQQAVHKRQLAAQVAEAERFTKARSAVISGIKRWMREGYTAAEAARKLPVSQDANQWGYSYTDLINMLPELGISRSEYFNRSKGGAA